jgi:hypothetical protein
VAPEIAVAIGIPASVWRFEILLDSCVAGRKHLSKGRVVVTLTA